MKFVSVLIASNTYAQRREEREKESIEIKFFALRLYRLISSTKRREREQLQEFRNVFFFIKYSLNESCYPSCNKNT